MRSLRFVLVACCLGLFHGQAVLARICTANESGNFTTGAIWSCGSAPAAGDTLIIPAARTVTISSNLSYSGSPMTILISGTLAFNGGGAKLSLPCNSTILIFVGGSVTSNSGGNSQTIKICNVTYWSASDGTANGPNGWPVNWLPVELVSFEAVPVGSSVQLKWRTASESGTSHFTVLRSSNIVEWETLAQVEAAGQSHALLTYAWEDRAPLAGTGYYKLVQCDLDGMCTDQGVAGAMSMNEGSALVISPNPASGGTAVIILDRRSSDPVQMTVATSLGQPVLDLRMAPGADGNLHVPLGTLSPGTYQVIITYTEGPRASAGLVVLD